ncbi:MAG: succinate dehydrogenase assembly factor 2 [Magnetococcales bacterium]|nr:succinate dehydrogenase assembly factor 2 [Magnetococcales bacterium]
MLPRLPLPATPAQRKLIYHAGRRSMAEMERLMARFLEAELTTLSDDDCMRLEALLHHPDVDLLDWLAGVAPVPSGVDGEVLARLRPHAREHPGG